MAKNWITSDWHLGESRLDLLGRPFNSPEEMVETLITNHNRVVNPDDRVYVVGDVCYQKAPEFLKYVERFNGHKFLIRGNHDRGITDEQFKPYFEQVIPDGQGIDAEFDGIPCHITHYPGQGKQDRFNLVGHIHSAWKYQLNMFNIGVDVNHFRPVDLSNLPFHVNAITKFYDEDVWVAYNPINQGYVGTRGRKGRYFVQP